MLHGRRRRTEEGAPRRRGNGSRRSRVHAELDCGSSFYRRQAATSFHHECLTPGGQLAWPRHYAFRCRGAGRRDRARFAAVNSPRGKEPVAASAFPWAGRFWSGNVARLTASGRPRCCSGVRAATEAGAKVCRSGVRGRAPGRWDAECPW